MPYGLGEQILDKETSMRQYVAYMLDRTNTMFKWSGLPDTIPEYMLELYLQIFGYAAFVKVDEFNSIQVPSTIKPRLGVHIFYGGVGGERDIYYRPKMFTAANPRLKKSLQVTILYPGDDTDVKDPCVLMANDRNYNGLIPLFNRYAQQLTENDISVRSAQINARAQIGISCSTDREKETARKYLDDLEAGKLGIIGESAFLDGVRVANVSTQSANVIIQLIELQQYLKASWFNELGLNVNFNMKREYMSEEEIAVNTDILLPLVDDMLKCRQEAAELLNEVFGLNVSVEKSSAWANKEREEQAALAEAEAASGTEPTEEVSTEDGEPIQTDVQAPVQSTEPGGSDDSGAEVDGGDVVSEPDGGTEEEEDAENIGGEQADVTVNIIINTEGGDVEVDHDSEPETQEEPEEPDAESDDA